MSAEDKDFCLVCVKLEAVVFHPCRYVLHAVVEVGLCLGGVRRELEDELGVISEGDDVDVLCSEDVCEWYHVDVEEGGAEG